MSDILEVGDLVEVKYENWLQDGACELVHARLWIVAIETEDSQPVYLLGERPRTAIQSVVRDMYRLDAKVIARRWTTLSGLIGMIRGRFHADALTKIKLTPDVMNGVGALRWSKVNE